MTLMLCHFNVLNSFMSKAWESENRWMAIDVEKGWSFVVSPARELDLQEHS